MKNYDVQTVTLKIGKDAAFAYIAAPENLPKWTRAFKRADSTSALMATPEGSLEIGLKVDADRERGTIDWQMTMPDGSVARALSRVMAQGEDESLFSFVLLAPPVPLEKLEGALEAQKKTLREELGALQRIFDR